MKSKTFFSHLMVVAFLFSTILWADEGQWPPDQIQSLPFKELRARGLMLTAADLWDGQGGGLMTASVSLGGCSAGFVSPDGLILTNHHCAFPAIQQASTKEKNYLRDGFLARSRAEEAPARAGLRALVPRRIVDVTERVIGPQSAAARATLDRERYEAVERARKEIMAECEKTPGTRCQVTAFYDGLEYKLHEQVEIKDVRLVYAPPRAVGEFGGEIDNWQWPRHTGDFSVLRAYVAPDGQPADYAKENVPFHPARWIKVSEAGVKNGDLVMILGYPGRTNRFLSASGVRDLLEWFFPTRAQTYAEWIAILESEGKKDPDVALRVATQIKILSNREKNARGQIAGLKRNAVLDRVTAEEAKLRAWIVADPRRKAQVGDALEALEAVLARERRTRDRDFLLTELPNASNYLGSALTAVRWAKERKKPDLERDIGYQERDVDRAKNREKDRSKTLAPAAERKVLVFLLKKALALPDGQRIKSLDAILETRTDPEAWLAGLDAGTGLGDENTRLKYLSADLETLRQSDDSYIRLALQLENDMEEMREAEKELRGALLRVRPPYLRALKEFRGGAVYPDANATLRLSVAEVKGYSPREAIWMEPRTTLAGLLEKTTGEEPFALPDRVLKTARAEPHEIPVCFLATGDTTGGNSGSPVVNGRGELVGLNFDRVWENVAGDFGWSPRVSRNVSLDIRFALWLLETVEGAKELVQELRAQPK